MFVTEITYIGDPDTVAKEFVPIVSDAAVKEVEIWQQRTLPGHFTPSAVGKYNYVPVTKKYAILKARKKGHQNPMVFSGDMKRELNRTVRVTSLKTKVDVRLRMSAHAINLWPDGGGRKHNFSRDLTATTDQERSAMALSIQDRTTREIQRRSWMPRTVVP